MVVRLANIRRPEGPPLPRHSRKWPANPVSSRSSSKAVLSRGSRRKRTAYALPHQWIAVNAFRKHVGSSASRSRLSCRHSSRPVTLPADVPTRDDLAPATGTPEYLHAMPRQHSSAAAIEDGSPSLPDMAEILSKLRDGWRQVHLPRTNPEGHGQRDIHCPLHVVPLGCEP